MRYALGTDLIGGPTHPLHEAASEFRLAVDWGMSPHEALRAGTIVAAEAVGIAADTGSLEPGKAADIVAVAGNPLHGYRDAARATPRHEARSRRALAGAGLSGGALRPGLGGCRGSRYPGGPDIHSEQFWRCSGPDLQ